MEAQVEHRLKNRTEELGQIPDFVQTFARQHCLSPEVQRALDLCLTEWVTNLISHAFEGLSEHVILVRLRCDDEAVQAEVEDDGGPFNPLTHPPVDTSLPLEQKPVGGLGIHIIRSLMDSVEYRRRSGRNILRMTKGRK